MRPHLISNRRGEINAFLLCRHHICYGAAGDLRCLVKMCRTMKRYRHRMLRSRTWAGGRVTWAMLSREFDALV